MDELESAVNAHRAAIAAQQAMRDAAHARDDAVRTAYATGTPVAELAAALGVNRYRIHAMMKKT